jgi:hypothetical protein
MRRCLTLVLLLSLAGCQDAAAGEPDGEIVTDADETMDSEFVWMPPVPFDGAVPPEDPGPGTLTLRLHSLDVGTTASTGYDLDGFDTRSVNDPVGCGILDGEGGVDNRLQALVAIASTIAPQYDIQALLFGNDFELFLDVRGHEDGEWVRVDVRTESELLAEDAPGLIGDDGVLEIYVEGLALPVSTFAGKFTLPLRLVRLRFQLESAEPEQGLLGGAMVWDDGSENDLESIIQALVDTYGDAMPIISVVPTVLIANRDIAFDGLISPCNGISLASYVTIERVEEP